VPESAQGESGDAETQEGHPIEAFTIEFSMTALQDTKQPKRFTAAVVQDIHETGLSNYYPFSRT